MKPKQGIVFKAKAKHEIAYQDLCDLLQRHAQGISSLEMLAIASNVVGKLLALQDHRTVSIEEAREVIVINIERGNEQAIEELKNNVQGNAKDHAPYSPVACRNTTAIDQVA